MATLARLSRSSCAQRRVGEREQQGGERQRAQQRAARAAEQQAADQQHAASDDRAAQKNGAGSIGAKSIDQFMRSCLIAPAVRAVPARAPGRPCSCRSART